MSAIVSALSTASRSELAASDREEIFEIAGKEGARRGAVEMYLWFGRVQRWAGIKN